MSGVRRAARATAGGARDRSAAASSRDEVAVLRMPPHVGGDERAERPHPQAAGAQVVERAPDERRAEPAAFEVGLDLGVDDVSAPSSSRV